MRPQVPQRTRRAFTLIELLTVIAIIALLAAILFPVMAAVRRNAKASSCMTNMQAIIQAMKMYKDDWRVYPDALYGVSYGGGPVGLRLAQDYVKDPSVFTCPESPTQYKGSTTLVNPTDPMTGQPYQTTIAGSPVAIAFPQLDTYDFQYRPNTFGATVTEVHYKQKWTNVAPSAGDDPRQLYYRDPPDSTVVTWCLYHTQMDTTGKPAKDTMAVVGFLSGRVQKIPASKFLDWSGSTPYPWQVAPKP